MKVFAGVESIQAEFRGAVLSIGNFDGVHLGHQRILRTARAEATVSGTRVVAMTFEPHPLVLLRPDRAPARLTPWPEKLKLLEAAGVDAVIKLDTNRALLDMEAESFVQNLIVSRVRPSRIVEGPDFGFGRGRRGDVELLRALATDGGFTVHVVDPHRLVLPDGRHVVVSSSVIRQFLAAGDVGDAACCLGRPYALVGTVIAGEGVGRSMGFPTINLCVDDQLIPAEGVYAGMAEIASLRSAAAISIGRRPTFDGHALAVEAFVLDHGGDWYGQAARLDLHAMLRQQRRFAGVEELAEQIRRDVEGVRQLNLQ